MNYQHLMIKKLSNDDYKNVESFNKIIQILKEENIRNSLSDTNEKDEMSL